MVSNDSDDIRSTHRRAPVIGLTTYLEQAKQGVWDVQAAFLPQQYFDAVTASGGIAVLLPPQPNAGARGIRRARRARRPHPDGRARRAARAVRAERHPLTDPARPDRDAWELALFRGADERRMPVLAICRGLQLVNVARGGTLHQHLPEALGHRAVPGRRRRLRDELRRGRRRAAARSARRRRATSTCTATTTRASTGWATARRDRAHRRRPRAGVRVDGRRIRRRRPVASRGERRGPPALRRARGRRHPRLSPIRASNSRSDVVSRHVHGDQPGHRRTRSARSPRASVGEVDAAIARAVAAQRAWAALAPVARADALRALRARRRGARRGARAARGAQLRASDRARPGGRRRTSRRC